MKKTLLLVLLFGMPVVIFVEGHSSGWWHPSRNEVLEVFGIAAAVAIAALLFVPAFNAAERVCREQPEVYWLVLVAALVVTGVVAIAADKWFAGRGVP